VNATVSGGGSFTCPSGYAKEVQSCYRYYSSEEYYSTAQNQCEDDGGTLVVVDNSQENNYVLSLISGNTWLGLNDTASEGNFVWEDGSTPGYTNWDGGEPNNSGGEDCAEIMTDGRWNDAGCWDDHQPFVCEIPNPNAPLIRKNGSGTWATSVVLNAGDTVNIRMRSANTGHEGHTANLSMGSLNVDWLVTTGDDESPDSFDFADQSGVAQGVVVESNTVTISGIAMPVNVSVGGDRNPEIRINGGAWVTSGTINNGETLQSRMTTNADIAVANTATVTVGSGSDTWSTIGDLCASSPSVGTVCADGSIFVGDGNMYVTDVDQSAGIEWSTVDQNTEADSSTDGAANQAWIVAYRTLSQYPAFQLCENLNRHGHTDWFLPARYQIRDILHPAIGGSNSGDYWASDERDYNSAWVVRIDAGSIYDDYKDGRGTSGMKKVRCVRRD
jgi:C-type mannose receptor